MWSQRRNLAPGAFLDTRFLRPLSLSQEALARAIGVSRRRINEIVRGRRAISPDTAIRLGHYFGTGPQLWLNLQSSWDLHLAQRLARAGQKRKATDHSGPAAGK